MEQNGRYFEIYLTVFEKVAVIIFLDDSFNLIILIFEVIALLVFIMLSAFFSGTETALFSLNKLQIKKMQKKRRK